MDILKKNYMENNSGIFTGWKKEIKKFVFVSFSDCLHSSRSHCKSLYVKDGELVLEHCWKVQNIKLACMAKVVVMVKMCVTMEP